MLTMTRRWILLVLMLCAWAPSTAEAKPPSTAITPKMLSSFDDPLVSSTAGLCIASHVLEQAWQANTSTTRRARAVALASSALASSRAIVAHALKQPEQVKRRPALTTQRGAIDEAIAALQALPEKSTGPLVRKAATATTLALLQAEASLGKTDPRGVAKARAAAVDAIIGETGLLAIIGENGSQAIIGENGSQAIIGETGTVAVNAIIGETGLVASAVTKTSGEAKLAAPAQKLVAAQRAMTGAHGASAMKSAIGQAAAANRAMVRALQQL